MAATVRLTIEAARALAEAACRAAGADADTAEALAEATLSAERNGRASVGFAHLLDYLDALKAGRINGKAQPVLAQPLPAVLDSDADGGIAQLGFERAFDRLTETTRTLGIAIFTQHNGFTTGELGYYVRRLAEAGLAGLAFTNANAFLAPAPGLPKVYSTNPMAFAFPLGDGLRPVLIDQSSSGTAFVNVAAAARKGVALDEGLAVDAGGRPTRDAAEAILGALLPFGGRKGANIALMVELMSAGLSGGAWSRDMADFQSGSKTLDAGLTVIAIRPQHAPTRAADFVETLKQIGLHVPGTNKGALPGHIDLDEEVHAAVKAWVPN